MFGVLFGNVTKRWLCEKNYPVEILVQHPAAIIYGINRKLFLLVGGDRFDSPEKVSAPCGALAAAPEAQLMEGIEKWLNN